MSTRDSATNSLSKGINIEVVGTGCESSADSDNVKVDSSHQGFQFQEEVPYVDADCDTKGEDVCQISSWGPREQFATRIPTKVETKTLTYMAERPAVDIEFQDLTYSVRNPGRRTGQRTILKAVSGKFRVGELTAILGSSGAGKSTLMNILAGYVSAGVSGTIKTNGHPRQLKFFSKLSSYIMQEDLVQPFLTVQEGMQIAANLKLGNELKASEKQLAIDEVLCTLGLVSCRNTRTEYLSGGERKRLSIALELVSNPPVIFLDEPTTGLDIVAIKQCLSLLKLLAQQGRTIICTIHQPNASHFQLFDQVYILAKGHCIYQGASQQLVPFMSSVGLHCPKHYNPADYVLEMIQGEYVENVKIMSAKIQNGKLNKKLDPVVVAGRSVANSDSLKALRNIRQKERVAIMPAVFSHALMDSKDVNKEYEFPTSCLQQFIILLRRLFLQQKRNLVSLGIQLFYHLFSAVLLGCIFLQVGNDISKPFTNVKFCMCVLVFFLYTYTITPVLLFPTAVKLLKREYFNRWYGLKAYYFAITVASLPTMLLFGTLFCLVSYALTSQPLEPSRFIWFCVACLAVGMVSESHGMIVGSIFNVTNGSIVAPASCSPLLALAVYGMGHGKAIEGSMAFLMSLSHLRYGLVAIVNSLYGHNRSFLSCLGSEIDYCHYKDPKLLLRDLGMADSTTLAQIFALLAFVVIYRFVAYLALRYRLTSEFSNQVLNYIAKILRHK